MVYVTFPTLQLQVVSLSGVNPLQAKPLWNISHREMPILNKAGLVASIGMLESNGLLSSST